MCKRTFLFAVIVLLFLGRAAFSAQKGEIVTIILHNGDKIKAEIENVTNDKVEFKAKSSRAAYEYGEGLNVERIKGIQLASGAVLSVKEYDAYRKSLKSEPTTKKVPVQATFEEARESTTQPGSDLQYEELKKKPISEMTENEFKYFMIMREKELSAQAEDSAVKEKSGTAATIESGESSKMVSEKPAALSPETIDIALESKSIIKPDETTGKPLVSPSNIQIEELVDSFIEADLVAAYLSYLDKKVGQGQSLTPTESILSELIQTHPKWLEKTDAIGYVDKAFRKTLERVYLYNPDGLITKLGLEFDQQSEMDYLNLMEQLHRKIDLNVNTNDFRGLVEVFGEGSARALREILGNYATWQFVVKNQQLVGAK